MRVTAASKLVGFESPAKAIQHARMGDEFVAEKGQGPLIRGYAFDRTRLVLDLQRSFDGKEIGPEQLLFEIDQASHDPSAFTSTYGLPARFLSANERLTIEPEPAYGQADDARVELQFDSGTCTWCPDEIGRQFIGRRVHKIFRNAPLLFVYIEGLDVLTLSVLREIESDRLLLYWR